MQRIEVWKNNSLLNAKAQWNVQEHKLFGVLLSDLNEGKGDSFSTSKRELEAIFEARLDTFELKKIAKSMVKKGFSVNLSKNNWAEIQIFSSIKYENGIMTMNMTKESIPYLYELKDFTKYVLADLSNLNSKYSIRVFELLKRESFKKKHSFTMKIEDLREFMGISNDEYTRFPDFEKNTLKLAEKEINESTSVKFKYEKIKSWRTITEIKFIYLESQSITIPKYMNFKEFNKSQLEKIMRIGLEKSIEINNRNTWSVEPQDYILAQAEKTKKARPNNFFGYFIKALEEDWAEFEEGFKLEKDQISIEDITPSKKTKQKTSKNHKSKNNHKDFEEREYDYDKLERQLLGWD